VAGVRLARKGPQKGQNDIREGHDKHGQGQKIVAGVRPLLGQGDARPLNCQGQVREQDADDRRQWGKRGGTRLDARTCLVRRGTESSAQGSQNLRKYPK
jgi:hypothetical protein